MANNVTEREKLEALLLKDAKKFIPELKTVRLYIDNGPDWSKWTLTFRK